MKQAVALSQMTRTDSVVGTRFVRCPVIPGGDEAVVHQRAHPDSDPGRQRIWGRSTQCAEETHDATPSGRMHRMVLLVEGARWRGRSNLFGGKHHRVRPAHWHSPMPPPVAQVRLPIPSASAEPPVRCPARRRVRRPLERPPPDRRGRRLPPGSGRADDGSFDGDPGPEQIESARVDVGTAADRRVLPRFADTATTARRTARSAARSLHCTWAE